MYPEGGLQIQVSFPGRKDWQKVCDTSPNLGYICSLLLYVGGDEDHVVPGLEQSNHAFPMHDGPDSPTPQFCIWLVVGFHSHLS